MNKNKPKQKTYYDCRVESMVPATITYRVLAEDAKQAYEMIKPGTPPTNIKYRLHQKRNLKMTIYDASSSIIRFLKNF